MRLSAEERFASKHAAAPSGCWDWLRPLRADGYASFSLRNRETLAHRVAWELHVGPIPDGSCVLHRCNNRKCVNPAHLFLGSQAENVADMVAKGRQRSPRGHKSNCRKGHPLGAGNVWKNGRGRTCRECRKARYEKDSVHA